MATNVLRDLNENWIWKCRACGSNGAPRGDRSATMANARAHRETCNESGPAAVDRGRRALSRYLDRSPDIDIALGNLVDDLNKYLKYQSHGIEIKVQKKE